MAMTAEASALGNAAFTQGGLGEAANSSDCITDERACSGYHYAERSEIGGGNQAKVFEVQMLGENGSPQQGSLAYKAFLNEEDRWLYEIEVQAMTDAQNCPGIVKIKNCPLSSKAHSCTVCFKGTTCWRPASLPGFVMEFIKTPGASSGQTLLNWVTASKNRELRTACALNVYEQLKQALICLHQAAWIHGDLKSDNIYVTKDGAAQCPTIYLADLGLAGKIGGREALYTAPQYRSSGHLPGSVFAGRDDTLRIQDKRRPGFYVVNSIIDWCSFIELFNRDFGLKPAVVQGWLEQERVIVPGVDCGAMGSPRALW